MPAAEGAATKTWTCCRPGCGGWGSPITVSVCQARRARSSFTSSRPPPGSRQALLSEQDHQCKLCAAPITSTTCELDHQNLQALCLQCHRNKTHDTGVALQPAGLRTVRGIAPTPAARLQAQQPQAGPHLPRNRRGPVPQERPGPCQVPGAHLNSAPKTTWSKPAKGTWRT